MAKMILDAFQGHDEQDRKFGYVCGDDGGFFFTWMGTLEETLATIEEDEQDGAGGLSDECVREFLSKRLAHSFRETCDA